MVSQQNAKHNRKNLETKIGLIYFEKVKEVCRKKKLNDKNMF